MNITDLLSSLDASLQLHNEGEWSGGEESKLFSAFNDGGIECETGEFLYGFARLLKPDRILETGTHLGIGASYMGMALKHNEKGKLDTIEFIKPIYDRAVERIHRMGLQNIVNVHHMDVANFDPHWNKPNQAVDPAPYKMILLDTEPQTRFEELIRFYPYLEQGGYLFIHDLHRHMAQVDTHNPDHPNEPYWPWGALPEQIKQWVREDKLRSFHFGTPRGLVGFYKPHENDYNWK